MLIRKPIKLYSDASPHGVGACLMYVEDGAEWSVAYASHTLPAEEQNYAQIEGEALGITFGIKWFNQYLYGCEFTLVTDHYPLCILFGHTHGVCLLADACVQW